MNIGPREFDGGLQCIDERKKFLQAVDEVDSSVRISLHRQCGPLFNPDAAQLLDHREAALQQPHPDKGQTAVALLNGAEIVRFQPLWTQECEDLLKAIQTWQTTTGLVATWMRDVAVNTLEMGPDYPTWRIGPYTHHSIPYARDFSFSTDLTLRKLKSELKRLHSELLAFEEAVRQDLEKLALSARDDGAKPPTVKKANKRAPSNIEYVRLARYVVCKMNFKEIANYEDEQGWYGSMDRTADSESRVRQSIHKVATRIKFPLEDGL